MREGARGIQNLRVFMQSQVAIGSVPNFALKKSGCAMTRQCAVSGVKYCSDWSKHEETHLVNSEISY